MTQDQDIKTTRGTVESIEQKGPRWEIKLDGQVFSAWPNQVDESIVTALRVGDYLVVGYTEKPAQDGKYIFKNISYITPASPPSKICLLYTSPSPRDRTRSRMPSSA